MRGLRRWLGSGTIRRHLGVLLLLIGALLPVALWTPANAQVTLSLIAVTYFLYLGLCFTLGDPDA